jgi:hypothetical protein
MGFLACVDIDVTLEFKIGIEPFTTQLTLEMKFAQMSPQMNLYV